MLQRWDKHMSVVAPGVASRCAYAAARALQAVAAAPRMPLRVALVAALWPEVAAAYGTSVHEATDVLWRLEVCALANGEDEREGRQGLPRPPVSIPGR